MGNQGKFSFVWSLILGMLCLVFGVQNLFAAKLVMGAILTAAGVINLYISYRLWAQRRDG